MYLKIRDLPSLVTTSTGTTTASATAVTSTITSVSQSQHASSSTISSNSSSSYLSTSTIHATVVIPNQKNVPYDYYYPGDINGTVYIAFGGVLGFLLFLIILIWSILSFKSWYEARTQKHYRATLKQNYNNLMYTHTNGSDDYFTNDSFKEKLKDPSYVATDPANTSPSNSYNSRSSMQSSSHVSDISEKLLKQKQAQRGTDNSIARKSMVFINNHNSNPSNITNIHNTNSANANEEFQELFVSPTEVLFNGNKFTHGHNNSYSTIALSGSSVSSSPMHTFGLFSNNNNNSNRESISTPSITVDSGTPIHAGTSNPLDNSNMNNNTGGNTKTKKFRPPSVHLDQLLDQQ